MTLKSRGRENNISVHLYFEFYTAVVDEECISAYTIKKFNVDGKVLEPFTVKFYTYFHTTFKMSFFFSFW